MQAQSSKTLRWLAVLVAMILLLLACAVPAQWRRAFLRTDEAAHTRRQARCNAKQHHCPITSSQRLTTNRKHISSWALLLPSLGGFTNQLMSLRIFQGAVRSINHSVVIPHLGGAHIRTRGHPNFTRIDSYVDAEALRNCSIGRQLASADTALRESERVHFVCVADPWHRCRSLAARFNCSGRVSLSCNWSAAHLWLSSHLPPPLSTFMQKHLRLVAWTQLSAVEELTTSSPQLVHSNLVAATQRAKGALVLFTDPFFSGALKAIGSSSPLGASCDPLVNPAAPVVRAARAAAGALCDGKPFLSVHWRRGDFFGAFVTSMARMAHVIGSRAEQVGVLCVFLLSDSSLAEQDSLRTLTEKLVPGIKIRTEASLKAERGAEIKAADVDALALMGKLVAAQAAVFIGTHGSSFTGQVIVLRNYYHWSTKDDLTVKAGTLYPVIPVLVNVSF